jgi:Zn-dependent protease
MNCQVCSQETVLPFHCAHCGRQFCSVHRLPENHACPQIKFARAQRQEVIAGQMNNSYQYSYSLGGQPFKRKGRVYFSPQELTHLGLGALLVIGIGLSFGFGGNSTLLFLSTLAAIMAVSFFTHEIAHKVTAQKRGMWAEFRLTTWGSVITMISIFLPFKFISPGAVMISGSANMDDIGKVSIAGPITNIVLSTVFLAILPLAPSGLSWVFAIGAFLNAYIAIFNLIPFGILDGYKIISWNKKIWVVTFAVSAILTIISFMFFSGIL